MRAVVAMIIICFGLFSLVWTQDLKQKNPETIFLTDSALKNYGAFLKKAPYHPVLAVKVKEHEEKITEIVDSIKAIDKRIVVLSILDVIKNKDLVNNSLPIKLLGEEYFGLIVTSADDHLEPFAGKINQVLSSYRHSVSGIPYTNYMLDKKSESIQGLLFPAMFVFSVLLLILIIRSPIISLILFTPCLFSAGFSLLFIKVIFGNMNMVTSIVPLICFTINLSLVLHLYYSIKEYKSIHEVIRHKIKPILLMLITTSIGFGSLIVSDIKAIRDFAFLSSFIIVFTSVLTFMWIYSFEKSLVKSADIKIKTSILNHIKSSMSFKWIGVMSVLSVLLAIFLYPKIPVLTDATEYFSKSSGVKENMIEASRDVVGMPIFDLLIPTRTITEDKLNKLYDANFTQTYQLVDDEGLKMLDTMVFSNHLSSPDNNYRRFIFLGIPNNFDEYQKDLDKIHSIMGEDILSQGLYHNLMVSQGEMINTLIKSLLISLFIISFIAYFYTRELMTFVAFLFVNTVPVIMSVTAVYLVGSSINIATVMTYAIAMGIIVDSSFHILHALKFSKLSFDGYIETTIKPIVLSSFVFILCFSLFIFHDFLPIKEFGLNLVIILILGLIFDVLILPTLILSHNRVEESFHA